MDLDLEHAFCLLAAAGAFGKTFSIYEMFFDCDDGAFGIRGASIVSYSLSNVKSTSISVLYVRLL